MILICKETESDLKGKNCKEDDEAESKETAERTNDNVNSNLINQL